MDFEFLNYQILFLALRMSIHASSWLFICEICTQQMQNLSFSFFSLPNDILEHFYSGKNEILPFGLIFVIFIYLFWFSYPTLSSETKAPLRVEYNNNNIQIFNTYKNQIKNHKALQYLNRSENN